MEANFFRHFSEEATPKLQGKRIEKIYQPQEGLWTLKLGSRDFLLLFGSPKSGCLLRSASKPDNPSSASSTVQWWRKRVQGRKVLRCLAAWPDRQLALELAPGGSSWLVLSLRSGLSLSADLPAHFGREPAWPSLDAVLTDSTIFREYPQVTPPLRKTLQACSREEAASLYATLIRGEVEAFHGYLPREADGRPQAFPWALPDSLIGNRDHVVFSSAGQAALETGWRILQSILSSGRQEADQQTKARRRLTRNLDRLEADEERLRRMADLRRQAERLQSQLYRFDVHARQASVEVLDEFGRPQRLELDPQLTLLENMQRWFERAKKGQRGLDIVARRREALRQELQELEASGVVAGGEGRPRRSPERLRPKRPAKPRGRGKGLAVHEFLSSDGYALLRGKNSRANHHLLSQVAKPFDYWFHAQDVPGAHVLLLRDHEGQSVPEQSFQEAATLAGLASQQAGEARARVICALVKDVRKQKGAPLGQVRVEAIQKSLLVPLDADLERALKRS